LSRLSLLKAVALVFVLLPASAARAQSRQDSLLKGAREFVSLVEIRDTQGLMERMCEEIRKDFDTKTGIYCLFFETKCFREEDARERSRRNGRALLFPLQSIADLLTRAKDKRFLAYDNLTNGKITLLLSERTPETARLGQDAVNFYFRFEQGQWKLRNVEYN
jgi:hypothetical protein